jgi:hypothetical protein
LGTYALIPGRAGDPWEWHRLVPELASRGQEAIAIRLSAEDDAASWSEYVDAVIDAIGDRVDPPFADLGATARCPYAFARDRWRHRRILTTDVNPSSPRFPGSFSAR